MKNNFVIHLVETGDSSPSGWVLITNPDYKGLKEILPFSLSSSYEKGELVSREGKVYMSIVDQSPNEWDATRWESIDNAYSEIPVWDATLAYSEDSFAFDLRGNLKYTLFPTTPGDKSTWQDPIQAQEVSSAVSYFTDEIIIVPRTVSGTLVKLVNADIETLPAFVGELEDPEEQYKGELTEKCIAYYDASQIATLSKSLLFGDVPAEGERVAMVRDISGNGNHAIQMDVRKRPKLAKNPEGQWYLRFDPGTWLDTKFPFTGEVNQIVNIAGRGTPRFMDDVDGKIRVGMKSTELERFWAWGGEALVPVDYDPVVLDEVTQLVKALSAAYPPRTQGTLYNLFRGETTLRDGVSDFDISDLFSPIMTGMFDGCVNFNDDLSGWNVSGMTNMRTVFRNCHVFQSDLSGWNVDLVDSMDSMFMGCHEFESDLSSWNTENVTSTYCMFRFARKFNSDLSSWNVGLVESFSFMFEEAEMFQSDLSSWDTSSGLYMMAMFRGALAFTSNLSTWCVEQIETRPDDFMDEDELNGTALEPQWGQPCP